MVKKIVITGAGGQIAYSLIFRIASGQLLGPKEKVLISLLEVKEALPSLMGTVMEIEDSAFPQVEGIEVSDNPEQAFKGADYLFFIGARPRGPGMERKDLLQTNAAIFTTQGKALKSAKKGALALVVGNPCNTNALILKSASKNGVKIFAMSKLDELRAKAILAAKIKKPLSATKRLTIWGNHSTTLVVDIEHMLLKKRPDKTWTQKSLQEIVQQRGAKVIAARGKSSAASAANAALEAMRDLIFPTPKGSWFSMSLYSEDNPYGIDENLFFSFPCISLGQGRIKIVKNLALSPFLWEKLKISEKELLEERKAVAHLL